ncbi:MAG: hypothetical protein AAB456_03080 [Patescibacteria group bacterium]
MEKSTSLMKKISLSILALFGFFGVGYGLMNFSSGAVESRGEYQIIAGVRGYVTKTDPTSLPPDYLVAGSQNVIINDQERIETRAGYTLSGQASTTAKAVQSDFVWRNSGATSTVSSEIFLRQVHGILQFSTSTQFLDLYEQFSSTTPARYATIWNDNELIDVLLMVNASSTLFEWSGGIGTYNASAATTITIDETIDRARFWFAGTRRIRVLDTSGVWREFTYTGTSGNQFTSVTPDPTTFTFSDNAPVVQSVRSNINKPIIGYTSDFIKVLNNQAWIGSDGSRMVYVSKDTDYTDFTFSSPRVTGEGALLTFDDATIGFESPDDEKMLVFSGKDKIYQVSFVIFPGSTSDREVPRIRPLLVSSGQGAISQELIAKIKQAVIWVNNNKELVEFGQIENLPAPQSVAVSDPIKPDFADADFTNGDIEFWRNQIFITAPPDGKIFIFDIAKRFWQPPQIMGIRRLSQFGDLLYGHGQSVPETYKLFTGLNDNANPIEAKAHFAYINGGRRDALKNFNRYFTEIYLASNTKVNVSILYDWLGANGTVIYELDGSDQTFLYNPEESAALGTNPLGTNPLGGLTNTSINLPKYRRFKPIVPKDHFEFQIRIESNDVDQAWQLLTTGANLQMSPNLPSRIIK